MIDWSEGSPTNSLESQVFTVSTEYDALNRPTLLTSPDQSVTRPVYNEANLLEQMYVRLRGAATETVFVQNIDYDAKGQRILIEYGNGVRTAYTYDPETFRLVRLLTTRISDNARLQDLQYTYDPVGNITEIRDDAQQTVFFNNAVVSPNTQYEYDAFYRLLQAEGREHAGQLADTQRDHQDVPVMPLPHPNDGQAMRNYTERYEYDGVGNILAMIHVATNGNWTRRHQYAEDSNRLLATSRPGDGDGEFSATYTYDTHGNMTTMPHLPLMRWDYQDRLKATSRQVVNEGTPETTYYVYDGSGQRVRKVTERQAAVGKTPTCKNERIYLGGVEIYREYNGDGETVTLERETLHVMNDQQRISLVETKTIDTENSSETPLLAPIIRYQLSNHLGSSSLEVDAAGAVISYEEYHPYGTIAYRSGRSAAEVSLKRYRYTGVERDEETGLNYHGARYYASWLGRWTAVDPIGIGDGINVYRYAQTSPILFVDNQGTVSKRPSLEQLAIQVFEEYLNRPGKEIPYRREVQIEVKVGNKWVEGRADFVIETREGVLEPIEFKGKDSSSWTPAQKQYLPALQAGAEFRLLNSGDPGTQDIERAEATKTKFAKNSPGKGGGGVITYKNVFDLMHNYARVIETTVLRRHGNTLSRITREHNLNTGKFTTTEENINNKVKTSAAGKNLKVKGQGGFATVGSMGFLAISIGGALLISRVDNLEDVLDVAKQFAAGIALDVALSAVLGSAKKGFIAGELIGMAFMESDNPGALKAKKQWEIVDDYIFEEFSGVLSKNEGFWDSKYKIEDPEAYQLLSDALFRAIENPFELEAQETKAYTNFIK